MIATLEQGLVEREMAARICLLAALAGEHMILIGPPGTAKSELARRLAHLIHDANYFERLLTRFSVPEELFGPLSLTALEADRYERKTEGFLPSASVAFIDEIFKANSAILNALLTILNEREFDQGATRMQVPLLSLVAASNELPQEEHLAAFYDRFMLRVPVVPVSEAGFEALLAAPDGGLAAVDEEIKLSRADIVSAVAARDAVSVPPEVIALIARLRAHLKVQNISLSDRRWKKILAVLRTSAFTHGRAEVSLWDLWLVQFMACEKPADALAIEAWFSDQVSAREPLDPVHLTHVVEAYAAQLQVEQSANDLAYDDSGKLALARSLGDADVSAAPRLSGFMRRRRYGRLHIDARVAQIQDTIDSIDGYLAELDAHVASLDTIVAEHLWIDPGYVNRARAVLAQTRSCVVGLRGRALEAQAGFRHLPQIEGEGGVIPEPMVASM